jgi:hypothetical protein
MKKVKIFLASSAELDNDKKEFELFISRKNKDLYHRRIFLELATWKDFISSMREGRTQDEYNKYIKASDISIFLFHTKLGRYTREEFDNAHEAFLHSKGKFKKPRIYTYFKSDLNEQPEITQFRDYIDSLDHFFDTYDNMDELFVKFGRQFDKLENEGVVIQPDSIDVPRIIKYVVYYFLLPLLVLGGAIMAYYFYQPTDLTVKIKEVRGIPGLPYKEGTVSLTYGDKTETLTIEDEVIFKQIPSKYKRNQLNLKFDARGFVPVDTLITAKELVELPVKRDNSLGEIFGIVKDENNMPVEDAIITVKDLQAKSDKNGSFRIIIPLEKQANEQRLTAFKTEYKLWDVTCPIIKNVDVPITLKK